MSFEPVPKDMYWSTYIRTYYPQVMSDTFTDKFNSHHRWQFEVYFDSMKHYEDLKNKEDSIIKNNNAYLEMINSRITQLENIKDGLQSANTIFNNGGYYTDDGHNIDMQYYGIKDCVSLITQSISLMKECSDRSSKIISEHTKLYNGHNYNYEHFKKLYDDSKGLLDSIANHYYGSQNKIVPTELYSVFRITNKTS